MDVYFAVFNCEKSEISKAAKALDIHFGKGSYKNNVAGFVEQGIMSMFQVEPTKYTKWFAIHLAGLVNKRIDSKPKEVVKSSTG